MESFIFNSGHPVVFLMPPVKACISGLCKLRGDETSLKVHHEPVTVTIYDVNGPRPAVKLALKCRECNIIYNYEKHGNKQSGGEKYYEQQRELIEISHLVYCTRRLHEFYCSLK